jgi:protein O-mannosyl-transferase
LRRLSHGGACLVLALLALLAYSNAFDGGWVLDNIPVILENPRLREPWNVAVRQITQTEYWWPFAGAGLYRPLTTLSYWVNYQLLGNAGQPLGYHVVNLLLHTSNAMLVYALGWLLTRRRVAACLAGAIFALHPVATEAVTNIVGRADLLATLGVVGGLVAHIRSQSSCGWQQIGWLAALMVAFGIGLFGKESAIVLPAVLVLYDLAFRKRAWVSYGVVLPVLVVWFLARQGVLAHNPALPQTAADYIDNSLLKGDAWTAHLTAVKIIGKYLWLLVWPAQLSADYSYNQIPLARWPDLSVVVAVATIAAALALAIRLWRRQPVASFCILFFFVTLAPVSNLFFLCGSTMAERFLYLPSIGIAVAAGWLAAGLFDQSPRLTGAGAGVLLLACGVRTYTRNEDWRDPLTFWVKLADTSPRSYRAHAGLAGAVIQNDPAHQYIDAAVASVQRALAIATDSVAVQIVAGQVYRTKGDTVTIRDAAGQMQQTPASTTWYQKSLATLQTAATLYAQQYKPVPASAHLLNTTEAAIYDEMGQTWLRLGNAAAAVESFLRASQANLTKESICEHLRFAQEQATGS